MYDATVVGGGFYGAAIAIYLKTKRGFKSVALIERERDLLLRASFNNQARVHNGYHYPRSLTTAFRSRVNLPRFVQDYPLAIKRDFTHLYAIARRNSRVTSRQFGRFCGEIGAEFKTAPEGMRNLFNPRLIEDVFLVEEYVFDAGRLVERARQELDACGVEVHLNRRVNAIRKTSEGLLVESKGEMEKDFCSREVFNCSYSGLNQFTGAFSGTQTKLKHEIAEIALVQAPLALAQVGITVMDGPFFSMMPFPPRGLHALSHVRYTPHLSWSDQVGVDPYRKLESYHRETRADRMIRDVSRYIPDALDVKYVDSLFEIKTVLMKNEGDDGRPILFEKHPDLPGCYSILGGKIDNIYDVLEKLDAETLGA